jgi:hypothetical protein
MGQEIVYCSRCRSRLLAGDFGAGKAVWVSGKPACAECVMALLGDLPPDAEEKVLRGLAERRASDSAPEPGKTAPSGRSPSTSRFLPPRHLRRAGPGSSAWIVAAVAAPVVLGVLVAAAARRPTSDVHRPPAAVAAPAAPSAPVLPAAPVVRPAEDPKEKAARAAYEKALAYAKEAPGDLPGRLERLEEAVWECRGTSFFGEAKREHDRLQKERAALVASEFGPILSKIDQALPALKFGEALDVLRAARERIPGRDWTSALDQQVLKVRDEAGRAFASVKAKSLEAARQGRAADAQAGIDQVASWGIPELAAEIRSAVAAVPPPAPPVSPEARAWREPWRKAVDFALARDYAAALKTLEAAPFPKDPHLAGEASLDLKGFRSMAEAHAELLRRLAATPPGKILTLDLEEPVTGKLLRSRPWEIELQKDDAIVCVSLPDLDIAALQRLHVALGGKPAEDLGAALPLLLESGKADGAEVPAKYLDLAARLASERGDGAAAESEARMLFREAERERGDPACVAEAYAKYRTLLDVHGSTLFVRRRRELLAVRVEEEKTAARDYVFPADRASTAGFDRAPHPKAAACWTASAADARLEITFSSLAATDYRAWILAGGCCAETFAFTWEEGERRQPLKPSPGLLRKTHAQHGGARVPSRFDWIPLVLPRAAEPGPRTLRVFDVQPGFSIAYIVVSATRTAPPAESQVKAWEKGLPAAASAPSLDRDPSLVAWWTLDEGRGPQAADSARHKLAGTLRNGPVWTAGARRGALSFDGVDDHVEIPDSPRLHIPGPFSVSAWIHVDQLPTSQFGMYVVSDYNQDGTRSSFGLRILPSGSAQFFWQSDETHSTHATSARPIRLGAWVHLGAVWDGTSRRLYVAGAPDGENATPQPRPDAGGSTAIGRPGAFSGLYFRGRIDDVRLYARALSPKEMTDLASSR